MINLRSVGVNWSRCKIPRTAWRSGMIKIVSFGSASLWRYSREAEVAVAWKAIYHGRGHLPSLGCFCQDCCKPYYWAWSSLRPVARNFSENVEMIARRSSIRCIKKVHFRGGQNTCWLFTTCELNARNLQQYYIQDQAKHENCKKHSKTSSSRKIEVLELSFIKAKAV